jgi:leucyl/phenylalanyl-tRNA--protein transferase
MIAFLTRDAPFPPVDRALTDPNGLLAIGGELSAERLVSAYCRGIFPWYSAGQPVLWWSPDPRMVLHTDEFRVSHSLRSRIRRATYTVTTNTCFRDVVDACARAYREGQEGTWITARIAQAYSELHDMGYAHSIEAWAGDELAGGLYGIAIGRMFFGESMFARRTDASKVALSALVGLLRAHDMPLIDCQQETRHLASLGARPISRQAFMNSLTELVGAGDAADWWPRGAISDHRE